MNKKVEEINDELKRSFEFEVRQELTFNPPSSVKYSIEKVKTLCEKFGKDQRDANKIIGDFYDEKLTEHSKKLEEIENIKKLRMEKGR